MLISSALLLAVFFAFGFAGVLAFPGQDLAGDILAQFSKKSDLHIWAQISRAMMCAVLSVMVPLLMFPARSCVELLEEEFATWRAKTFVSEPMHKHSLLPDSPSSPRRVRAGRCSYARHVLRTLVIFGLAFGAYAALPSLNSVMAVTGATLGLPTTFVLPLCIRYFELKNLRHRSPPAQAVLPECFSRSREMALLVLIGLGFQLISLVCTVLVFLDIAGYDIE